MVDAHALKILLPAVHSPVVCWEEVVSTLSDLLWWDGENLSAKLFNRLIVEEMTWIQN